MTADQKLILSMLNDAYNMMADQEKNVTEGEEYYSAALHFLGFARERYETYCALQNI